jgi:NAD(P)-dependent dehydrogenase (short-subunit alcohol dehydrogenase family)
MNKTMLITGTSRGIGLACADKFSSSYKIIGVARTQGKYVTEVGDITDKEFRDSLLSKYAPDVFINNAGTGSWTGKCDITQMLNLNTTAAIDLLLGFWRKMSPGTDIINVSSYSGWRQGWPDTDIDYVAYSSSKHALSAASQHLSFKKTKQVRVMTLEPQQVITSLHTNKRGILMPAATTPPQENYDNFDGKQQAPMKPEYVADTIEWMLQQPRWVNVQTLRITNNY